MNQQRVFLISWVATITALPLVIAAAPFTDGNIVVVRSVTDPTPNLAAPAYLDEYTFNGTLVQSIPMGDYNDMVNPQFTLNGGNGNGGFISRSYDGNYLVLGGYNAVVNSASVTTSTNARVMARVGMDGTVDTSTKVMEYGGNEIRSVASLNGSQFWAAGTGTSNRIRYAVFGATTSSRIVSSSSTFNSVNIYKDLAGDAQLYVSRGSNANAFYRVNGNATTEPGAKLPVLDRAIATAIVTTATSTSTYGTLMLNDGQGKLTLYLTDDDGSEGINGVQKWTSTDGTTWAKQYVLGPSVYFRGLTGGIDPVSGYPVLLATTSDGRSVYSIMDTGSSLNAWRHIADAAPGTMFHDVELPYSVPEPASLVLLGLGGLCCLRRRGRA